MCRHTTNFDSDIRSRLGKEILEAGCSCTDNLNYTCKSCLLLNQANRETSISELVKLVEDVQKVHGDKKGGRHTYHSKYINALLTFDLSRVK